MATQSTNSCIIVDRKNISVRDYFNELKRCTRPLTSKEEAELSQRIANGDDRALNQLVEANLLFVVSEAMKYNACGIPFEDLVEEGNMGMLVAAKRFDASYGTRFITYANAWINRYMVDAIKKNNKEKENTTSYDAPINEKDDACTLVEFITDHEMPSADESIDFEMRITTLTDAIKNLLSERQQFIINNEFGINCSPMSVNDISKALGVSRETVRIDKQKAFGIIRKAILAAA